MDQYVDQEYQLLKTETMQQYDRQRLFIPGTQEGGGGGGISHGKGVGINDKFNNLIQIGQKYFSLSHVNLKEVLYIRVTIVMII